MEMTDHTSALNSLERRYDPENDIGSPRVTHTDMVLIDIIRDLNQRVRDLEGTVAEMETNIQEIEDFMTGANGYDDDYY